MEQKIQDGVRPQQTLQTIAIPPFSQSVLMAGYDTRDGTIRVLDLTTLVEALVNAEKAHSLDRIDTRNQVQVTVVNGTAVGGVATGKITVPTGDVWYLNRLSVVCPADATGTVGFNILVSRFPKATDGTDKPYNAADVVAMGATTNSDLVTVGQQGEDRRLEGGDVLTLRLTATIAFTADKVFTLIPYGRKGKKLL